ncbi:MAG TPA: hypothetical protein VGB56_06710 [Flavisolibacter sp.]|jgi:hypothetical protein
MKKYINKVLFTLVTLATISGCSEKEYALGDLAAPTDLAITTQLVGQDATHPNGDGSGNVIITLTAKNALSYKIDYDANDAVDLVHLPSGTITKKYTTLGLNTYRITAVAYGKGGTSSTATKEIKVQSNFTVQENIVTSLTGSGSKTWVVEKDVPGHFGVGPWGGVNGPEWWSAPPNDKAGCCNCFYTAKFTFSKNAASNNYSLQVVSPDGAFTKTGGLTTLPGIPASGEEGCYSYAGATSSFSFIPAASSVPASASTKTSILLAGNSTYIGYGALLKEYEILSITPTSMHLRVQGTETGNAWYLKLIPQ